MPPGEPKPPNDGQIKSGENPDVLLDVPMLKVEELNLELEDLRAHISLRADLADVVSVNVGVDAYLDKVKLDIKGLEAQVLLKVGLDRVLDTFNRALEVIDRNPEIVGRSRGSQAPDVNAGISAEAAENLAPNTTILGEAVGQNGGTVVRSMSDIGELIDTLLDGSGAVTDENIVGNVDDLPVEKEYVDDEGRTVSHSRDDMGNIVERTLDGEGNTVGVSIPETPEASPEIEITEAAEKRAWQLGVDPTIVTGTGSGGRIVVRDVEKAAKQA